MREHLIRIVLFIFLAKVCTPVSASIFDSLNTVSSGSERLLWAKRIYYENRMDRNPGAVPAAYKELIRISENKKDEGLRAFAEMIMGGYYSSAAFLKSKEALMHFDKALQIARDQNLEDIEAGVYHYMGWNYYWQKKVTFAFEYFLKANNLIKKNGYGNYFFVSKHLYDIGFMYYDFANYKKAKEYLLESIRYPVPVKWYLIDNYNTLGLVYRELNFHDSAEFYFRKTLETATECRDTSWMGIATGNLAFGYFRQKDYDKAIPMFLTDYSISKKNKDWNSLASVLNSLSTIYTRQNKFSLADETMKEMDTVVKKVSSTSILMQYFLLKARLSAKKSDFSKAYGYLDSANRYHEKLIERNDTRVITQAEQNVEIERHLADIKLLESEKDKQVLLRNTIIIGAILLLIIAAQFINRMRIIHRRNLETLNNAKSQLQHYIASMRDKNRLIEHFTLEIERLNALPNAPMQAEREDILEKLQNATILTDADWDEFRRLFEKVHKGFFAQLRLSYPDLTNAEMRLMALTRLDLSRKEMAEMLGVSMDTIKKTRQRMNKKLGLDENSTIEQIAMNL